MDYTIYTATENYITVPHVNSDGSESEHDAFRFVISGADICDMFDRSFTPDETHEILATFFDYMTDYGNVKHFISENYL